MESFSKKIEGMKEAQAAHERAARDEAAASSRDDMEKATEGSRELAELEREEERLKDLFVELMPQVADARHAVEEAKRFAKMHGDKMAPDARRLYDDIIAAADKLSAEYEQTRVDWERVKKEITKASRRAA